MRFQAFQTVLVNIAPGLGRLGQQLPGLPALWRRFSRFTATSHGSAWVNG